MADSKVTDPLKADSKVATLSRLAQWRIDSFDNSSSRKSDSFKMGIWKWYLSVERSHYTSRSLIVRLLPKSSNICKEQPPFARFVMRISVPGPGRKLFVSQVYERQFQKAKDFGWSINHNLHGRFVIEVEFLDLKICSPNDGEATSICPAYSSEPMQPIMMQNIHRCLSRMFEEEIHFNVTINTSDGSLKAHKCILCANSPVFQSMFHHNLKEKESSTIDIDDMSLESCGAFLSYFYGTITKEDFWKHRLRLLEAANKYEIISLKDACEESLLEDISSDNILERLQGARFYQLHKLKKGCFKFLFEFGKAYDIREEMNNFLVHADRELILEMLQEMVITVWKPEFKQQVVDRPEPSDRNYLYGIVSEFEPLPIDGDYGHSDSDCY